MKTNKISLLLCLSILLHLQTEAQFLSYISTPKKNVAHFQKMSVYEDLKCTGIIDQEIFMYELNNSLYINDYPFQIVKKNVHPYEESDGAVIFYSCHDKLKRVYEVTIYYKTGSSFLGNVIEKNSNMRFGLAMEYSKDELTCQ